MDNFNPVSIPSDIRVALPAFIEQRIVCAAVQFNCCGKRLVAVGAHHYDKVMTACLEAMANEIESETQGFIDNSGNFLTREEAWTVAVKARQVIRRIDGDGDTINGGKLFSENLY